jgi:hypothetical protein
MGKIILILNVKRASFFLLKKGYDLKDIKMLQEKFLFSLLRSYRVTRKELFSVGKVMKQNERNIIIRKVRKEKDRLMERKSSKRDRIRKDRLVERNAIRGQEGKGQADGKECNKGERKRKDRLMKRKWNGIRGTGRKRNEKRGTGLGRKEG